MHAAAGYAAPAFFLGPPPGHDFHAAGHAVHAGTCRAHNEAVAALARVAPAASDTAAIAALKRNDEAALMALLQDEQAMHHGARRVACKALQQRACVLRGACTNNEGLLFGLARVLC
jgi:hypothetical protein